MGKMVFLSALRKVFFMFVFFGLVFLILATVFDFVVWPGFFNSYENWAVVFVFALFVALSATY